MLDRTRTSCSCSLTLRWTPSWRTQSRQSVWCARSLKQCMVQYAGLLLAVVLAWCKLLCSCFPVLMLEPSAVPLPGTSLLHNYAGTRQADQHWEGHRVCGVQDQGGCCGGAAACGAQAARAAAAHHVSQAAQGQRCGCSCSGGGASSQAEARCSGCRVQVPSRTESIFWLWHQRLPV
jgi:hypothetical protein